MDCFLEFLTGVIVKASSVLVCTKYILANCRTCLLIFLPSFHSLLATRQIPCYLTRWWEIHSHDKLLLVCIQITCKNGTIYYPASNHNLQFSLYRFDLLVTNYINLDEYVKMCGNVCQEEEHNAVMGADSSVELRKHHTGCGFFTLRREICRRRTAKEPHFRTRSYFCLGCFCQTGIKKKANSDFSILFHLNNVFRLDDKITANISQIPPK